MKDMEFLYRYLVLPFWLQSYMVGGPYYHRGAEFISKGWQGAIDGDEIHWFVSPHADTVESMILYCTEARLRNGGAYSEYD